MEGCTASDLVCVLISLLGSFKNPPRYWIGTPLSDDLIGHKEEMGGNALVRSAVPQDLMGQQEAQGWEGVWEVPSVLGVDRPAAGTRLGKGL